MPPVPIPPPPGLNETIADLCRRGTDEYRRGNDLFQKGREKLELAERLAKTYCVRLPEIPEVAQPDLNGHAASNGHVVSETIIREPRRVRELRRFLKGAGPQKRGAILEGTKIPVGTLGGLLDRYCTPVGSGRWEWAATEENQQEGEDSDPEE